MIKFLGDDAGRRREGPERAKVNNTDFRDAIHARRGEHNADVAVLRIVGARKAERLQCRRGECN
ncbi:hypothetical protein VPK21_002220 (plasmid) [Sinorhizobium kummerowiae]|uniref:hypothetical protein n=1 Tax=Sinorhizobium kummerowiae TaxID=158892 RepID=UPI002B4BFFF8|nr:hypothetical protein [Sinorhizobium kummerowiae]WRW48921.1 hypothetical protein VPK21_002220 [Sinorhizobium kummerowiae]